MDITNADPETLLQIFATLTSLVDWQDLRTASAGATRSNLEDAYKQSVDEKFVAIPKADGPEAYRAAKARLEAASAQYVFQRARTRHEIYKALSHRLERQLRVVEETLWTRKAALKARGGY